MFPVVSLGPFSLSSYGIFLAVGFLFGIILTWRLARAWDLNEERVLDLTLLTFLGGLLGARIFFILANFPIFGGDILKWVFFLKYQGFSFWGAVIGGFLTLKFFVKRFRLNFWQSLDFASVGLLGGLIFADLGCFLGGCNIGVSSKVFFALPMVGVVGKRIPVQAIEAILLSLVLIRIWKYSTHFHIQGTIASFCLIFIGAIGLIMSTLKENKQDIFLNASLVILGTMIFYKVTKRELVIDIKAFGRFLLSFIKDPKVRKRVVVRIHKSWYNYMVSIRWKLRLLPKILRKINVRFSHKDSKYY